MFQEDRLLAHWRYSESEWRAFAGAELAAEKSVKKMIVLITAGFAVLFCGLMVLLHPELVVLMIGVALAIIALMAGAAALSIKGDRQIIPFYFYTTMVLFTCLFFFIMHAR